MHRLKKLCHLARAAIKFQKGIRSKVKKRCHPGRSKDEHYKLRKLLRIEGTHYGGENC